MPGVRGINESEGEEIDQENSESDKSSNEDTDSSSGTDSDDDDSSELDEEMCSRRRSECLSQMAELEKQFLLMKEQLYEERSSQIEIRLDEVKSGNAFEYTQPLEDLRQNLKNRLEVADILKDLRKVNIKHIVEAEYQASKQNFESEKALMWDCISSDLEEKIRRLEEDRNSVDITSEVWIEQAIYKKGKRKSESHTTTGKRKKPVTVTGPYIIYMLQENEILEDWTTIRKALKATKQGNEYEFTASEQRVSARFADGKLLFKGDSFRKGESVYIDDKIESPWL